jgi:hypothetical protein
MTFEGFFQDYIRSFKEDNKGQRMGQFFMNQLAGVNVELYRAVPAGLDPYYNDKLLNSALEWVADRWAIYNKDNVS